MYLPTGSALSTELLPEIIILSLRLVDIKCLKQSIFENILEMHILLSLSFEITCDY